MQFLVKLFRENHKIMCCLFFRAQKIWCEERHWVKYLLYVVVLNYWNSRAVWARVSYNRRKAANRSVWHFWTCSFLDFFYYYFLAASWMRRLIALIVNIKLQSGASSAQNKDWKQRVLPLSKRNKMCLLVPLNLSTFCIILCFIFTET